jgi:hypothetical protein
VSEPTTRAAAPAKGSQAKHLGLTRNQWLLTGGIAVAAGLIFYLYRKSQANAAASTTATTASTAATEGTCDDGTTVPCGGLCADGSSPSGCDQSGELSTLQTEIGDLQSALAQGSGGGSGGVVTTPVTPNPTTPATPAPATTTSPAAATTSTPAATTKAGAISNLQPSSVGSTTAKVSWNKAANATQGYAYRVTDTANNSVVKSGNTTGTSVSLSGLKAKTTYNFGVQGLPGGPGNNIHFTTT